jgi:hypothetical protein
LIVTYLVMKIALQAVLDECNKIAAAAELEEATRALKSRIAGLELEFSSGEVDEVAYEKGMAAILEDLKRVSKGGLALEG